MVIEVDSEYIIQTSLFAICKNPGIDGKVNFYALDTQEKRIVTLSLHRYGARREDFSKTTV
jgi:hypothetical protein